MNTASFSLEDDVESFAGPKGPLTATGHAWHDPRTLEVTFAPQSSGGAYRMVIGPGILDDSGMPMDVDRDSAPGELPDDRYEATFAIRGPRIAGHAPSGSLVAPVDAIRLSFTQPVDQLSFSVSDDIVSFTGPGGPVAATGYQWLDPGTLEVTFDRQVAIGDYQMVLGPGILDLHGNPLDQDRDLVLGEATGDQYLATFTMRPPRIVSHTPSGNVIGTAGPLRLRFSGAMDQTSFSPADDVVSFIGPAGPVAVTGYRWVDARTLEVDYDQPRIEGTYRMVIGPQILDLGGNALDRDGDLVPGEPVDDLYSTSYSFGLSGTLTQDTTWTAEHGVIVVGSIWVPAGRTLVIEPGTILKFRPGGFLDIKGTLDIRGTAAEPVTLTSYRDDTVGGDTNGDGTVTRPVAGDWEGLRFDGPNSRGTIDHADIRYAAKAVFGAAEGAKVQLRASTLRYGGYGVYVYTPLVEIEAENTLIANNAYIGLFARADSRHVFRNSTIVGNGFQGSGWTPDGFPSPPGAGIHLGAANLTLENSIVAFNANGLDHSTNPEPPLLTIRNSDFLNPAGQEIIWDPIAWWPQPRLDRDGNMIADPLFVDRAVGNYELKAGSPAIDSGRGIHAPASDLLGRPRYDDQGVSNLGNGFPVYVDLGAYERQQDSAAADLAVTYVSNPRPEFVSPGDTFTVQWTVTNVGLVDFAEDWMDTIYLSDDPYLGDDQAVATVERAGPLISGESYTVTHDITVPVTSGPKYVLVQTNAGGAMHEAVDKNNLGVARKVLGVDLPVVDPENPVTGTL
ncbi:MAG: hypothetical protein FJ276_33030, partial [Planctomycetes bacterium]|nr:hypothetical protein [Planctomycetota bacterium]